MFANVFFQQDLEARVIIFTFTIATDLNFGMWAFKEFTCLMFKAFQMNLE